MGSSGLYIVLLCPRCGSVRYAKEGQKTAQCLRCGYKIPLNPLKVKILLRTRSREAAVEAVKRFKVKAAEARKGAKAKGVRRLRLA